MTIADTDRRLSQLLGQDIPGGCDHCNAVQSLHQEDVGIWRLQVAHDEWCPELARRRGVGPPAAKRRKNRRKR